ncbi:MAG: arginase family protein [Candidatus Pacearchaeota archaeon]|nr:arginase family protein [Candidatus Pacearchaeota archaeon]
MFIVKVPGLNSSGKTIGCEKAGNAILETLKEIYSNEQGKPIDVGLLDLEEIHLDNGNLELANKLIYENALEAFETKPKTFFIGGDHSISYSLSKAFLKSCRNAQKEPCLIVFDAHPDCMGSINSKIPNHEEWLRTLIDAGFPAENVLLVGVRNSDAQEIEFLSKSRIRNISINQLLANIEDICDTIMEFSNGKELYLSLDIDVIDPAFAPATGYPEPGGLTSRQFIYLIQRLNKIKNLKAIDLVEINPEKDSIGLTIKLGAKILAEFL